MIQCTEPIAPSFLTNKGKKAFISLRYKMQCFLRYKYELNKHKKEIMKHLFISSENTYYKIDRKAKERIKEFNTL